MQILSINSITYIGPFGSLGKLRAECFWVAVGFRVWCLRLRVGVSGPKGPKYLHHTKYGFCSRKFLHGLDYFMTGKGDHIKWGNRSCCKVRFCRRRVFVASQEHGLQRLGQRERDRDREREREREREKDVRVSMCIYIYVCLYIYIIQIQTAATSKRTHQMAMQQDQQPYACTDLQDRC